MIHTKRIGVFLAGALSLAACGGDGGGSISFDDLGDELVASQCARYVRCGVYTSEEACAADAAVDLAELKQSIAIGRVTYDGDNARDCLDGFAAASCDTTSESARVTPPSCVKTFVGTVADAGACFNSNECKSSSCDVPDCTMACCAGTCNPTVADAQIGQSCATANCVDGSFCNDANMCVALLAANAACQSTSECGYGLTCGNSICTPSANRGEACVDGSCDDLGDRCDSNNCVARSAAGGACSGGFAGLFDCQRPLVCNDTSLKCENPPTAGQACEFFCASGLFCNENSQCEAPRANGMDCGGDSDCASDFCDESGANPACANRPLCGS